MNHTDLLPVPRVVPALDPGFRPAALAVRAFRELCARTKGSVPVRIALEQSDGSTSHFDFAALPESHPQAAANARFLERCVKFLLWSRGGWRIHLDAPQPLGAALAAYYRDTATGRFDDETVARKMFDQPLQIVATRELPLERSSSQPLGRHLQGCRIGFDLGGSDRKVAAVVDGEVVFSDETVWDPYFQKDPQYHFAGILDSLQKARAKLPRLDAIGGSAAGVYVQNRVKVASLFRGVPPDLFQSQVVDMFLRVQQHFGVPLEVINDGEVTALAGSMSLGANAVLGVALGTSTAGGYVTPEGNVTSWLDELAFVPFDYRADAPIDEWSGDRGCGAQYLSQQAVGRLLPAAGIEVAQGTPLPQQLEGLQALMAAGDERALRVYQTLGTYLGYAIAHCADFYELRHVLVLGRVSSGKGGDVMLAGARAVLGEEFPELAAKVQLSMPDERMKRHGQAVAAASLPAV